VSVGSCASCVHGMNTEGLAIDARDRLDALRTALAIGAGAAGVATLVLAGRRQMHVEEVAVVTEKDAIERRVTDLY
jgi:hypothetical protein